MELTLAESLTLTKSVSGFLRAVKSADTGTWKVPIFCDDDETWHYQEDGQYSSAVHVDALYVAIYGARPGAYSDDPLIEVTLGITATKEPETDPYVDCPEDSMRGALADYSVHLDWAATGGGVGGAFSYGDVLLAKQYFNSYYANAWANIYGWNYDDPPDPYGEQIPHPAYGENDPTEEVEWDENLTYEVEITGTFDLKAKYSTEIGDNTDYIYGANPHDNNPHGLTSRELEVYYTPRSGSSVTVTLTVGGVVQGTWTVDASDFAPGEFEDVFKNGFGRVHVNGSVVETFSSSPVWTDRDMGQMIEAVIAGMPNGGHDQITESETGANGTATWTPSANGATYAITSHNAGYSHEATLLSGAADTTYNALIRDWNTTTRAGVEIGATEYGAASGRGGSGLWQWPVNTKENNVLLTTNSSGIDQVVVYHPGELRGFDADTLTTNRYYELHETGHGARRHNASDRTLSNPYSIPPQQGVRNLTALNEPAYDEASGEQGFADWRCELYPSYLSGGVEKFLLEDALTVDAPTSSDKLIFADHTKWSVSSGTATITDSGNTIVVACTTDATIAGDCSAFTFRGARYCDLVYTSAETSELTIDVGDSRHWHATPSAYELDLGSPHGISAASTTQSQITGTPDWGWGIGTVGTMTIAGLKAGQSYTFTKATLKRKSLLKCVIFGGAWIGDAEGQTRQADDYTMFNLWTRKGLVFVDGLPAAEIRETHHINTSGVWSHEFACTDDADAISPADGFVTWTHSAVADLETAFLIPGTYTEGTLGDGIALDARLYAVDVIWPHNLGNCTLNIWKRLRGGIGIGLAGTAGTGKTVTLSWGATSSGPWTTLGVITADDDGLALTESLQQTIEAGARWYRLLTKDDDGNDVTAVVQVRNRNLTVVRMLAQVPTGATQTDCLFDDLTGVGCLAYIESGRLYVARSFDFGLTWASAIEITGITAPESPCLFKLHDAAYKWGLAWDDGTDAKVAYSVDGFASHTEVATLMTGLKHVRVVSDPVTGILVAAGWRTSDQKIVSVRSFDYGATWSSAIVVFDTAVPEQGVGLTTVPDRSRSWQISLVTTGGDVKLYQTKSNGNSWALVA